MGRLADGMGGHVGGRWLAEKVSDGVSGRTWDWWSSGQGGKGTPRKEDSGLLGTPDGEGIHLRQDRHGKAWGG